MLKFCEIVKNRIYKNNLLFVHLSYKHPPLPPKKHKQLLYE